MTLRQAQDSPARADYDYRGLGRKLRPLLEGDGRGWRACAIEIGVTPADLSRICSGQATAAHKVIAICDWIGVPVRRYYQGPKGGVFHGKRTETEYSSASRAAGAPAGRAIRRDGRLALPPLAEFSDD